MQTPVQHAARPGRETSEAKVALGAAVVSVLLFIVGLIWPGAPVDAVREILIWAGTLIGGGASVSYILSRAAVKARALKYGRER